MEGVWLHDYKHTQYKLPGTHILHFSHLTDALIQNDLQEQLGLSALLKGTSTNFLKLSRLGDSNQQPFVYWPNALNRYATLESCTAFIHTDSLLKYEGI